MAVETNFYVLAYDIRDNKRRLKVAKALEAQGDRVQESVFEVFLTARDLEKLIKRIRRFLKPEEDSLRIYFLCAACRAKARGEGLGQITPPPKAVII